MQMEVIWAFLDMSNGINKTTDTGNASNFLHLFQCPEIGNEIPNMFYLCIMGRDHESGKPRCLSENQFLLDEGLLIVIF